jgi:hypothetical protein
LRGKIRGRLSDSQGEESPETGSDASHREFIRRPARSKTVSGQRPRADRKVFRWHGSCPERNSESGPSEREKLRRVNPKSGCQREIGGIGSEWSQPSRTSKRQGRQVLAGTSGPCTRDQIRCRGGNLRKAAVARKGCRSRFGSYSVGEPKPKREGPGGNFRIDADTKDLKVDCRGYSAKPRRGIAQAIRRYIQRRNSEGQVNSTRGGRVGGNTGRSARANSTSKPFGDDAERRHALKRREAREHFDRKASRN